MEIVGAAAGAKPMEIVGAAAGAKPMKLAGAGAEAKAGAIVVAVMHPWKSARHSSTVFT
jgi:hypothetical protein